MRLPPVRFSNWIRWVDRVSIKRHQQPGIYILAHFAQPPSKVDLQAKEIIYFGQAHDRSLLKRWKDFEGYVFKGNKSEHSGGRTYKELFDVKKIDKLYVAAFPVIAKTDILRSVFILYVERRFILEYVLKWGERPVCNGE